MGSFRCQPGQIGALMDQVAEVKPNLFIVGQPKCGTTALHQFLDEHPDIFMSPYKEPSYLCSDFHEESDAYHGGQVYFPIRKPEDYMALFADAKDEQVIGESSVNYLYSKTAAREIHTCNPDARIIIVLRNPVDFLYSLYQMNVRRAWEPEPNLKSALAIEDQRRNGKRLPANVHFPSNLYYMERAKYYEQVKRFVDLFDRNRIKILVYEDFQRDNASAYREVLEFLGVDASFQPEFRIINPSRSVRNETLNALLRQRWVVRLGYLLIPQSKYVWVQRNVLNRLFGNNRPPPLNTDLSVQLRATFREDVERTAEFVGQDLVSKWLDV